MPRGCYAIIAAGGTGSRMGLGTPKQFIEINGKPIIAYTIEKFEKCGAIDGIVIVAAKGYEEHCVKITERFSYNKVLCVVSGGEKRQQSVYEGLLKIPESAKYVLIHDAARPFVTEDEIIRVIDAIDNSGCAILAASVKDTIKTAGSDYNVTDTPDRDMLYAAQTPQGFSCRLLMRAYEVAVQDGFDATDDSQLTERIGIKSKIVLGSHLNFKITTKEDLFLSELIIKNSEGMSEYALV